MRLGRRLYGIDERRRVVNQWSMGTIGGDSKIGMPIVETVRRPLVASGGVYLAPSDDFMIGGGDGAFNWGAPTQNTTTGVEYDSGFDDQVFITETDTYFVEVHIEMAPDGAPESGTFTFEIATYVDPVTTVHASDTETISAAMVFDLSASIPITAPAAIVVPYASIPVGDYLIDDPASYIRITQ